MRKEDGYVPLSRRFPLAERKQKKQGSAAAAAIPDDVDLGADLLRRAKDARELTENSPLYDHVLECSPKLWPMVVLEAAGHLVAVLPLVPSAALERYDKLKKDAAERGFGIAYHESLASIRPPARGICIHKCKSQVWISL